MAGPVVILTGASRGIGLAVAHYLLSQQARLVVVARSQAPLEELRAAHPEQVRALAGDLGDVSFAARAAAAAKEAWGRIDAVVVNHGTLNPVKRVADSAAAEWQRGFDINVHSAVALIQASLPSLRASHGRILLVSSGAAIEAYVAWGVYGASKAVLNHLALTLAVEEPDVTTVSIRPGVVDTEMQREVRDVNDMDPAVRARFIELKATGGLLKPEQPGNVIAKLALNAPKELSGKFLSWNDGRLAAFQD
ncbi:short-chain dehydrogenase [Lineolata rhizophorae]|uniref:Short-chain dehydrogenase n=1 Tax=Lineolata rhizophorae TaxID=578093 RepID=A0A6A6NPC1_9PEZI|nr:short-chain dehydrogenase [Lineolata rhizophorae]